MNYETYKKNYFVDPQPEPRFRFAGAWGATLYYLYYKEALAFYREVLGPPAYSRVKTHTAGVSGRPG